MDTLMFGLGVTAIGILIVFFGLVVLIGLIKVISLASQDRKKAKAPAAAPAVAPVAAAPAVQEAPAQQNDDALIAAITAAVAACMENGAAFTVRRVKRITNANPWQTAGREEQVYSRM